MKKTHLHSQKGFTIIELLMATVIFSMILTVIVASFLQIGHMFYKGVSINNTNNAARNLVDAIAGDARLTSKNYNPGNLVTTATNPTVKKYFCIGGHRYIFKMRTKVQASDITANSQTMNAGVIQDNDSNCSTPDNVVGGNTQLLGPDMQLNNMQFVLNSAGTAVKIRAHVIFYGADNTVFNSSAYPNDTDAHHIAAVSEADAYCSGNLLSTQFCSMADISANVTLGY